MTTRSAQAAADVFTATDDELLDRLDHLVGLAALGDRDAIGALAVAFGPTLLDEARAALGPTQEQDAGDVVHDFLLALLEGTLRYPPIRGGAIPWMKRMVRLGACRAKAPTDSVVTFQDGDGIRRP